MRMCQPFEHFAASSGRPKSIRRTIMKPARREICPIHRSLICCDRKLGRKQKKLWLPVQRIEDPPSSQRISGTQVTRGNVGMSGAQVAMKPFTDHPNTLSRRGWAARSGRSLGQSTSHRSTLGSQKGYRGCP